VEPQHLRLGAVFSLTAGTALLALDASIASVTLPTIARELHVPESHSVLVMAVYNLILAMTLMPLAAFGVRVGLRRLFLIGLTIYIAGAGLSWFANDLTSLLVVRGFQALGVASAQSVSSALVREVYPPRHLGRGLGFNTLAAAIGGSIAPVLGGMIVAHFSWHWVFVAGVPLAITALATVNLLPETKRMSQRFDAVGAVLCAATFGLAIYGLQALTEKHAAFVPVALLVSSVVLGIVFVRFEINEPQPVLPVDLLARPILALSVAGAVCGYLASTFMILALPFRLHALGFPPGEIGTMIAPYAVTATVFAPTAGMLSDRLSPSILGTVGLVIATVALLFLFYLPNAPTHFDILWPTALCGAGFGMFMAPNARLIIGAAPPGRAAPASSLVSTTRMMSMAVGSTLVGALLAHNAGNASMLIAAGLAATAGVLSAARLWPVRVRQASTME
jgi:DHA2 family multidrug resistance protein-like MFS transporter